MNTYKLFNLETGEICISVWFDARFIYECYRIHRRICGTPAASLVVVNADTGAVLRFE